VFLLRSVLFTDAGSNSSLCFVHKCVWRFRCDTAHAGHVQKVRTCGCKCQLFTELQLFVAGKVLAFL
jgi:hypothetical protein